MSKFQVGDRLVWKEEGAIAEPFEATIVATTNGGEPYSVEYHDGEMSPSGFIWWEREIVGHAIERSVPDLVNHPSHYSAGMPEGIGVIDIIKAQDADFMHGNVIKYILRWKFKGGLEDLKKAQKYLTWLIEQEEAKDTSPHVPYLDN